MIDFLNGYKTYLFVALAAVVFVLQLLGVVPPDVAQAAYGVLGFGGILGLRSAVAAIAAKQP